MSRKHEQEVLRILTANYLVPALEEIGLDPDDYELVFVSNDHDKSEDPEDRVHSPESTTHLR